MRRAQKLASADPDCKRHCIKMLSQFEFREHVFMVFEAMAMNLREVLKKVRACTPFPQPTSECVACGVHHGSPCVVLTARGLGGDGQYGRNVGLSILAVQKFAKQMLISLKHMKNCGVLHADIKLDNILVNDKHNMIKVRKQRCPNVLKPMTPSLEPLFRQKVKKGVVNQSMRPRLSVLGYKRTVVRVQ